jgi:alanyl-tRNA synthetase
MAIFEEKYGEKVRMVSIGDFSKELCGGIHIHATGEIGLFKIVSESSIAAGMRRIEALTGEEALRHTQESEELLSGVQAALSSPRKEILPHLEKLQSQLEQREKENRDLRQKLAQAQVGRGEERLREIEGVSVLVRRLDGLSNEEIRGLADSLKQKIGSGVVVLGSAAGARAILVVAVTPDLVGRLGAVELIREIAPVIGGGGGGRADFAQAGGKLTERLDQALERSYSVIERMISGGRGF